MPRHNNNLPMEASNMNNVTQLKPVNAVSLSSSSVLVELSVSQWTGRKLDRHAGEEVARVNNAKSGAATVTKKLIVCEELKAIGSLVSAVRAAHYHMTLPWLDTGIRLLPTAQYFDYHHAMTQFQNEFDNLIEAFVQQYSWEVSRAQLTLGDLFNADEYPSIESIRRKFSLRLSYIPMPDAGDFRIDVGNDARDQLTQQYQSMYETKIGEAMNDLWSRLYDALKHMSNKLVDKDGKRQKLYESMLDNVMSLVNLLDTCNITNDPDMARAKRDLRAALDGVTTDQLKDSDLARRRTKAEIDSIIASLPSLNV